MPNKAVFLDRDGTLNVDKDYVYEVKDLEFFPGTVEALKKLRTLGYKLVIITNQSGIGRGYYSEEQYKQFMKVFHKKLGVKIDGEYYCKHSPEENCECRKPKTKLIEKAIKEHNIDRQKSYFIGDKTADIKAGKDSGLKTILVKTGKAGRDKRYEVTSDFTSKDLLGATKIISKL